MTNEERSAISDMLHRIVDPLVTEIQNNRESHEKDINRLSKQSAEHYENFHILEQRFNEQIRACQMDNNTSKEKQGDRLGAVEQEIAIIKKEVKDIQQDLEKDDDKSRWSKEMWIMLGIAVAGPIFMDLVRDLIGGL